MVSEGSSVRGGKSPRSLAVKLTGVTAHDLPSTKCAKKRAVKKKQPCKWDEMTEKGYMSPQKKYQRTFAGKRVTSTGLAGALKRQANNAVAQKRQVILLEAQIADLPRNRPHHGEGGRVKHPLFGKLTKAKAQLDKWTDKMHKSEMDMRNGAFRKFDIDEAIKTSDRRIAEKALKKALADEAIRASEARVQQRKAAKNQKIPALVSGSDSECDSDGDFDP